jgi:murein DD-endopeptidase MepM/ murein hydrolase activator NlpD
MRCLRRLLPFAVLAGAALPAPAGAVVADAPMPWPAPAAPDRVFPIAGAHTYGEGFGAGRWGRSHQGQDVFADCGTPIVAPHAGTVRFAGFQGAAGNFLVLAPAGGGRDLVLMHLRDPAPARAGRRVEGGQRVGAVGETGDAVGCHLHVELWTAPGWYRGGHAVDPLRTLRAWDHSTGG